VAVVVVDHTNFVANSRASQEALKSANLLKSLKINAIILGDVGVGKLTLAKFILPKATVVDGNNSNELYKAIESNHTLIIKNFTDITNFSKVKSEVEKNGVRIIATASRDSIAETVYDDFFSLKITIPPLSQRLEDVELLANKFLQEVCELFGDKEISISFENLDLSKNCYSLRRSVYLKYLIESFDESDVMKIMESFLSKKIGGKNDYRENLHLYDVPIIRSGFKKFGSQLKMSEKFGLNRNTLRRKITEYKGRYKLL